MYRFVRTVLLVTLLSLCVVGSANAACPQADLNGDCRVDLSDLQILTDQWLYPPEQAVPPGSSADLNSNDGVDLADFALFADQYLEEGITLAINEFMAANSSVASDPQGQYDDWIEIHNYGSEAINVAGMYLTDDLAVPTKWRFPLNNPAATLIGPGRFLLVWADNDVADAGLHAGFKLDAGGEQIALFDRDGVTLIHSVTFPDQTANISFGCFPDGSDTWRFFSVPTPGAPNNNAYEDEVKPVQFSHKRGFYETPFSVTLATETNDAAIYYTLDGSEPYDLSRGGRFPAGNIYAGPISISGTVCLRAKAVRTGWKSSDVETQTYIFLADAIRQSSNPAGFPATWGGQSADYQMDPRIVDDPANRSTIRDDLQSLATVSLVMKTSDLFDAGTGIYANWSAEGPRWERPASIEMIYPDGSKGFQANCGVRIYGGVGRREKKKSFRLLFKDIYGPSQLQYALFGDGAADQFDTIILRSNFNDGYPFGQNVAQFIRDEFCRRLQLALGDPSAHGRFVHLYVNGLYWGLYNPTERPDASFAASYLGGDKEDWDAYNSGSPTGESTSASWSAFQTAMRSGIETNEGFHRVQGNNPDGTPNPRYIKYLDAANYIDYMLMNIFVGNTDWPGHNWYGAMNHVNSTGFKFFSWDAEWVMGLVVGHGLDSDLNENVTNVGSNLCEAYARLRNNADFRLMFGDRVHRAFFNQGPLYVEAGNPRWNPTRPETNRPAALYAELADGIERAMVAETARWGDVAGGNPRTIRDWRNERDWMLNTYMVQRPAIVFGQLRNIGLYPAVESPAFFVNGFRQHGGAVSKNDQLSMTAPAGTIWYTLDGTDPYLSTATQQGNLTGTKLVAESSEKRAYVPVRAISESWKAIRGYDDSAWTRSAGPPGGVGFERSSGYQSYISLDVGSQMYGKNSTCYIRIPFTFSGSRSNFDAMSLNVRYDDGFIAYLNGVEIARRNFSGTPTWNSSAVTNQSDAAAVQLESIDVSAALNNLQTGSNLLAIHGLNSSTTSSDFLISAELVAGKGGAAGAAGVSPNAIRYTGPITLTHSVPVKARALNVSTWSALNEAVYTVGPVAENLRITEIMYHPPAAPDANDPNEEFIELTNIGTQAINLNLVRFTNGIDFTFPGIELTPGQYTVVVQDRSVFEARYGRNINIAGQYSGQLNNAGERITLADAAGQTILDFKYSDGWRSLSDGEGFSLTVINPADPDLSSWDGKDAWRASAYAGGSPGQDDSGIIPNPGAIVINEVLAHAHAQASDWIELYNTAGTAINIGGWFLSDSKDNLFKYQIANGTTIGADGYLVFYQDLHFGNANAAGCREPFGLSENGESLYLSSAQSGVLTGYHEVEDFGASVTGVSFGRYYKASTDDYNFVAMEQNTPGAANSYPKVGPIVISEIMYHPDWPVGGLYTNDQYEYIELYNISSQPVTLYDYVTREPWKFTDGIEFTFPADVPVTIPASGYMLVVQKPDAFMWRYPSVPAEKILGPYDGKLSDAGESVELSMPGDVDNQGKRYYIRIERVNYSDGAALDDLWPAEPDGQGQSLTRKTPTDYANDPANWIAAAPSPGL